MRGPKVDSSPPFKLSLVRPCFNEEQTLTECVKRVLTLNDQDDGLGLEIVISADCSRDRRFELARELEACRSEVRALHHERNQGKGPALRTGFREASGDFVRQWQTPTLPSSRIGLPQAM